MKKGMKSSSNVVDPFVTIFNEVVTIKKGWWVLGATKVSGDSDPSMAVVGV
jgi:hypothetical protein